MISKYVLTTYLLFMVAITCTARMLIGARCDSIMSYVSHSLSACEFVVLIIA